MPIPPELARFAGKAGEQTPPVDWEDIKSIWKLWRDSPGENRAIGIGILERVIKPGADLPAVLHRASQIFILTHVAPDLLGPWTQEGKVQDVVFRAAAQIPMEWLGDGVRHGLPFDVEDFMGRLRET